MPNLQPLTDKMAITLSSVCAIHCLAMPLLLALVPSLAGLPFAGESFHLWMVLAVIPTSVYALTMGCKKHKNQQVLLFGLLGLTLLIGALVLGHDLLGDLGEKGLTLVGALAIAYGHFKNYRLCQQHDTNCCASSKTH